MNPALFIKEGSLRVYLIRVISNALTIGLTRNKLLSNRTKILI